MLAVLCSDVKDGNQAAFLQLCLQNFGLGLWGGHEGGSAKESKHYASFPRCDALAAALLLAVAESQCSKGQNDISCNANPCARLLDGHLYISCTYKRHILQMLGTGN